MELVTSLRELWRVRVLVAILAVFALLVGAAVAFKLPSLESRKYEVGLATASLLVDTPNSQVIEVAPKGSDTLGVRANLLANLMAEGVVKDAIAERAGIPADRLQGISESAGTVAPEHGPKPQDAYILTTRVVLTPGGDQLPIIEIEAQAPDAPRAAKLATSAVSGLRDYLDSRAADAQVADTDRLRVSSLGSPQAREVARGPKNLYALAAVIFVFGAGCAMILLVLGLIRGWRTAAELDDLELDLEDDLAGFESIFDQGEFADLPDDPDPRDEDVREPALTPPAGKEFAGDEHEHDTPRRASRAGGRRRSR